MRMPQKMLLYNESLACSIKQFKDIFGQACALTKNEQKLNNWFQNVPVFFRIKYSMFDILSCEPS